MAQEIRLLCCTLGFRAQLRKAPFAAVAPAHRREVCVHEINGIDGA